MNKFSFNTTKTLIFETGSSARLADISGETLGRNVLFITDPGLQHVGLTGPAIQSLESNGHHVTVFDSVVADPPLETLSRAVDTGRQAKVSGVVGFGGGSSMDVAKLAALLLGSGEDLEGAWGVNMARGPRLPLVLVPTTAGTGSEVTPVSIITVSGTQKRGVSSPLLLPDIAILDPKLTVGLPGPITAATGIDAMVHAIEAYASSNPNNNPVSKLLAREALRRLGANIETAVSHGTDEAARSEMLLGSMLAGQAFANSPVAAVHALAYPIGSTFHVPHGLSNALVLPHVLRFNAHLAHRDYSEIAPDVFPRLADVEGSKARCTAFIQALENLIEKLGLPTRLRNLDIPKSALTQLADDAMSQGRLLQNNPREVSRDDALSIYAKAW